MRRTRRNPEGTAPVTDATDVTRTKAFRRWFGDSKVVDEQGRPLVVWHGNPRNVDPFYVFDFDRAIDLGMHFGTEEAARDIVSTSFKGAQNVRPFYLSFQHPLRLDDPGDWISTPYGSIQVPVLEELFRKGVVDAEQYEQAYEKVRALREDHAQDMGDRRVIISALMRDLIIDAGYDGVKYTNESEDVGSTSWIAFHPEQIKLADGRNTAFDWKSPDVRFNPDDDAHVRFVYGARRLARGGFAPVVTQHGPGESVHEHGGWTGRGYDEDVALAVAKEHAEELASQYIGDWNIEIVPEGRHERANPDDEAQEDDLPPLVEDADYHRIYDADDFYWDVGYHWTSRAKAEKVLREGFFAPLHFFEGHESGPIYAGVISSEAAREVDRVMRKKFGPDFMLGNATYDYFADVLSNVVKKHHPEWNRIWYGKHPDDSSSYGDTCLRINLRGIGAWIRETGRDAIETEDYTYGNGLFVDAKIPAEFFSVYEGDEEG